MRRRTLLTVAGACLWPGSCFAEEEPKGPTRPDSAVLEAVLLALLSDPKSPLEPPLGPRTAVPKKIFFSSEAGNGQVRTEDLLLRHAAEERKTLSTVRMKAALEAAAEVARRAAAKERFQNLTPRDPRIVLYSKTDHERDSKETDVVKRIQQPQVFRAYPPGYTSEGRLAVVHLTFPWSGGRHSGNATFVLTRKGNVWSVVMRQYLLYV